MLPRTDFFYNRLQSLTLIEDDYKKNVLHFFSETLPDVQALVQLAEGAVANNFIRVRIIIHAAKIKKMWTADFEEKTKSIQLKSSAKINVVKLIYSPLLGYRYSRI